MFSGHGFAWTEIGWDSSLVIQVPEILLEAYQSSMSIHSHDFHPMSLLDIYHVSA